MGRRNSIMTTSCCACNGRVSFQARTCPHCGQPSPAVNKDVYQAAADLCRNGDRIAAIRKVHEMTGWGLAESKAYVERVF